jgi:hypothetical protein
MTSIPGINADLAVGSFAVAAIGGALQPLDLMGKTARWPA